jgi:protein-S-isoprenylcysteine O-methyltransferase Ste14
MVVDEKLKSAVRNIWGNILFYLLYLILIPAAIYILHPYFEKFLAIQLNINFFKPLIFKVIGILLIVVGALLNITALSILWKIGRGTNAITEQSKNLVILGPFKWVRNPCHLGVILIIVAYSALAESYLYWVYALIYFIAVDLYLRFYEEKLLEKKFGVEYLVYKQSVPKWLPFKSSRLTAGDS